MPYKNLEKKKEYHQKWYLKNKEKHIQNCIKIKKEHRIKIKEWFKDLKKSLTCNRCPEEHPATLVFHHKDSDKKEFGISWSVGRGFSKRKILSEIEKCEILCMNCHAKEHWADLFE